MSLSRLLLITTLLAVSSPAAALRCGGKIVRDGDHQARILKICGEPDSTQSRTVYRAGFPRHPAALRGFSGSRTGDRELLFADRAWIEVIVEEWTYNFGPHRLMRIVRFENGLVTDIRTLGYGYVD